MTCTNKWYAQPMMLLKQFNLMTDSMELIQRSIQTYSMMFRSSHLSSLNLCFRGGHHCFNKRQDKEESLTPDRYGHFCLVYSTFFGLFLFFYLYEFGGIILRFFLNDGNCALNEIQNGLFLRQTLGVKKQGMYFLTISDF